MCFATKSLAAGAIALFAALAFAPSADAQWGQHRFFTQGYYPRAVVDYGNGYGSGGYYAGPAGVFTQPFYGGAPVVYYGGPPMVYYGGDGTTIGSRYHRGTGPVNGPGYGGW